MSRIYKVLIVEDEPFEARRLQIYVERYSSEREIQIQTQWEKSAMDFIAQRARVDLILLDIELPGITGMEAARLLRVYDSSTPIIFVTNLAQYAVEGYEVDALDFMVKPVGYHDFAMRMDKAFRALARSAERNLLVATTDGTRVLPSSQLVYVEASNHDLVFHLTEGEPFRKRLGIPELLAEYPEVPLLRISKGRVVNMESVDWVRGSTIRTVTGEDLPISRSMRKTVESELLRYLGGR